MRIDIPPVKLHFDLEVANLSTVHYINEDKRN